MLAQALYQNLAALPRRLAVDLELRVAEGPFCRSFHLSNMELAALVRAPERVGAALAHPGAGCVRSF